MSPNMSVEMSAFALDVMLHKYSHSKKDGTKETWKEVTQRVTKHVMHAVDAPKALADSIQRKMESRQFIPGGRYLYAAGRPYHQTQNCFGGETRVVTRDGTKTLFELNGTRPVLMTTNGVWTEAEVREFGEQLLWKVVLIRNGKEKVIYATEYHAWRVAKNCSWDDRPATKFSVDTCDLKPEQRLWDVFGYGISRTPLSLSGIQHGIVFGDGCVPKDEFGFNTANVRLCGEKCEQLAKYFDGYPIRHIGEDIEVSGLPRRFKARPSLYDDRSYLLGWLAGYFAADGCVDEYGGADLSSVNRANLEFVREVCYLLGIGTYGVSQSAPRVSNLTHEEFVCEHMSFVRHTLVPEFFLNQKHQQRFIDNPVIRRSYWRVKSVEPSARYEQVYCAVVSDTHEFVLEDNILTGNCLLLRATDSREGWADLMHNASMALMTGAGIGVDYSEIRGEGKPVRKTGGFATGPFALMQMVNEAGRGIMQGGSRRSAIWAGLNWRHPDIHKFIQGKNWIKEVRDLKEKDFNFPATLDGTNISVQLDDAFFAAYNDEKNLQHPLAQGVYWAVVERMLKTGEPGFSVDTGKNVKETLRNACTEVCSADDSDICNLGSINLARIDSLDEFKDVLDASVAFLLAGTVYSDVPYAKVDMMRTKNRRLGLGLMGVHEWLLLRGRPYGQDDELRTYLEAYATSTDIAKKYADAWELSHPIKTRAIAPTGTIGIIAETTTGIEPIFCAAYKRRYLKGSTWNWQYVLDPTAKRLVEHGVDPEKIEDAYVLSSSFENVERRLAFQAWVQQYVDHGISSTLNLPSWGSENNNASTMQAFGHKLMIHLPKLRGITTYPDGARGGQPITAVSYKTASKHVGEIFVESVDVCELTRGGSCGA